MTDYPLYRPELEHDACGVGFLADVTGRARRDIVTRGLTALARLAHRGAPPSLATIDGCGVMTAIPWALLARELAARDVDGFACRALGMFFAAPGETERMRALVEARLRERGALSVTWRLVPVNADALAESVRATAPEVHQAVIGFAGSSADAESSLFRSRLAIEQAARDAALTGFAVVSLSTRTVVYKGLLEAAALPHFYRDLNDGLFESSFIMFHQRFSTNTAADWSMAQPFRVLAHNGEINTIGGNRIWMRARANAEIAARLDGLAPVGAIGSDSHTLDEAIDLLRAHGVSLPHGISRLLPPEWERDREMPDDVRAFYEYQALASEPWEGPAALVFCDGRYLGASLDRNGFRPLRVVAAAGSLLAVASEAGVLDLPDESILDRRRLGPGDMLVLDLVRHTVMAPPVVRRMLARQRPYRRLVDSAMIPSRAPLVTSVRATCSGEDLLRRQALFLYSHEEIEVILRAMAATGGEPSGSMGDDTPPAVLSSRDRLLSDFFRQRFAQVTNPPIDPHREASVMSLRTLLGAQGRYLDESHARPRRLALTSPIVSSALLPQLAASELSAVTLPMRFEAALGVAGFSDALHSVIDAAIRAVANGAALLILSDRQVDAAWAPLPALLVTAAVHHALIDAGLRPRVSLVVDTAEARDAHQVAALCAYGAAAVCPYLAYDTVASLGLGDATGQTGGTAQYRLALERGLLKIASKMGVCTMSVYCGAQLFEILGVDREVARRFFPGTPSPLGGITLDDLAAQVVARHARVYGAPARPLDHPGEHGYRRNGEYHAVNPLVVRKLHQVRAAQAADAPAAYEEFASLVHSRPPTAIRDLLEFAPQPSPVPIAEVEPADAICRRFFASAMSVGALSPEAHRVIAIAMNRLGARSNSGEGGEEPSRFRRPKTGDWSGSRTKQVASARFGVTPAYLRSADELQIKIAQGSKPGEGGQLPGEKVVAHIAELRYAQAGTALISPPVHHDIYSIEDLAQLVFDLRAVNPLARINVKLVSTTGVGIIAAGVAKSGADAIQISGHDGGTGASPRASIKHAGMPWELGLAEAHQVLTMHGLRHRVVLQTDGGFKTGRDVAVGAALGADEYGFGTAALVAIGCVMARQCHLNTCPAGIASQRTDLRARFTGTPEMLIGYLRLVAEDVRAILASLGLRRLEDLVGRADLLVPRTDAGARAAALDLTPLLVHMPKRAKRVRMPAPAAAPDPVAPKGTEDRIGNTDRAYGAAIAGAIAARHGDAGLPPAAVRRVFTGSGGQSFGAFALPGMHLTIVGDANDYVAKAMHGGELVIRPDARERGRQGQVLVGNTALYGATGGRLFVAGCAGERFAVRNSGATAVVEGVGDHACEYMTGGVVLILGPTGRNFAAGMSGGTAYVFDPGGHLGRRCNLDLASIGPLDLRDQARVRELLVAHRAATGSRKARVLLQRFDQAVPCFRRVAPVAVALSDADTVPEAAEALA